MKKLLIIGLILLAKCYAQPLSKINALDSLPPIEITLGANAPVSYWTIIKNPVTDEPQKVWHEYFKFAKKGERVRLYKCLIKKGSGFEYAAEFSGRTMYSLSPADNDSAQYIRIKNLDDYPELRAWTYKSILLKQRADYQTSINKN